MLIATSILPATPQIPDILIHEGKEHPIQTELLNDYFKKYPDRKPETTMMCSALWRGYIATFEFVQGTLSLKDVVTDGCDTPKPALQTVAPNGKRLAIDWYSGLLLSSYGENDADPYTLESLDAYEKYSIFEIAGGKFRRVKHFDNKQYHAFRKRQMQAFKKTSEYDDLIKKKNVNGRDIAAAEANILSSILYYTRTFLVD